MTDVNIATSLIMDALNNLYDVAFLTSGDSGLVPAINAENNHFASKIVTVFFHRSVGLSLLVGLNGKIGYKKWIIHFSILSHHILLALAK